MITPLQRKDEVRLRVLRAVYESTDGRTNVGVVVDQELFNDAGALEDEVDAAIEYLIDQGLLKEEGTNRYVVLITHDGVVEVEQATQHPSSPTEHFSPQVIYNVSQHFTNSVVGSQQIGGTGNTATVDQKVTNTAITEAVQQLRDAAKELPEEKRPGAEALIDTLANHVEDLPKAAGIIRQLLTTLGIIFGPEHAPVIAAVTAQLVGA